MTPPDEMRQGPIDADFNALRPGQAVGRFTIEALVGWSSFGATYRARDGRLGCTVILREFLPPALTTRSADGVAMTEPRLAAEFARGRRQFLNGGRIVAALRAPCMARVLGCLETNGTAYMVMEQPEGLPLADRLAAEGPLSPDQVDRLLWPLLEGLELVHSRGFFHGDISPDCIVLDAEGRPTLVDFGAAGSLTEAANASAYAAPEQIAPMPGLRLPTTPGKQGPWTDIYAVAATFHHVLTGAPPPPAIERLQEDRHRPLMRVRPAGFHPALLAGLDRGLGLHPHDRPQTIAQWRAILWRTDGRGPARRPPPPTLDESPVIESPPLSSPMPPPPMPSPIVVRQPAVEPPRVEPARVETAVPAWRTQRFATPDRSDPPAEAPPFVLHSVRAPGPPPLSTPDASRRFMPRRLIGFAVVLAVAAAALGLFAFQPLPSWLDITGQSRRQAEQEAARAAELRAAQAAEARAAAERAAQQRARDEEEARRQAEAAEQAAARRAQEAAQAEAEAKRQAAQADARLADPRFAQAAETALALGLDDRRQLQTALTARGFDPGGIDGVFGPRTRAAIAAWQKSRGEPATGFLSAAQRQALIAAPAATTPTSGAAPR